MVTEGEHTEPIQHWPYPNFHRSSAGQYLFQTELKMASVDTIIAGYSLQIFCLITLYFQHQQTIYMCIYLQGIDCNSHLFHGKYLVVEVLL